MSDSEEDKEDNKEKPQKNLQVCFVCTSSF